MAEKEGFEPSIPFWGIHDFQSCALGQLRDFSMRRLSSRLAYDTSSDWICQVYFSFFGKNMLFCYFPFSQHIVLCRVLTLPSRQRADSHATRNPQLSCRRREAVLLLLTWE